jgi:hypothetical protein
VKFQNCPNDQKYCLFHKIISVCLNHMIHIVIRREDDVI